ncbi:MAG: type II secretion system F family protein [Saccharofermentanales bacterium]
MAVALLAISCSALVFAMTLIISRFTNRNEFKVMNRINAITASRDSKAILIAKNNEKGLFRNFAWLFEGKKLKKIGNDLSLANFPLRADEFIIIWATVAIVPAGLVALFNFNIIVIIALIAIFASIPPFILKRALKKRMVLFDKQLGDALTIMGNCLRAGFSFNQAIESIAHEMPDPIAKEFTKTLREIKLGLSMEKALVNMVDRLKNNDLELIVSAVLMQRQVGGNLSEILDSISDTIKERLKLKGEIKVLTATGRTSGIVVGLLPVFLMVVLMVLNPDYVSMFFNSTIGRGLVALGVVLEITGFLIVRKIVDIKF